MPARPTIVAFDIIGTVFSLEPMRAKLIGLGLPSLALEFVYVAGLRDTFAMAATSTFAPFLQALSGSLDEVLALHGLSATDAQKRDVLETMKTLPPHEDAGAAFEILSRAGIRIIALSNGARAATEGLLERAGLGGFVEQVLSVEDVSLAKPRAEVYRHAVEATQVTPGAMMLVATHPWDIHGARMAGLTGGYVARGRPFPQQLKGPDVAGQTLRDVAEAVAKL